MHVARGTFLRASLPTYLFSNSTHSPGRPVPLSAPCQVRVQLWLAHVGLHRPGTCMACVATRMYLCWCLPQRTAVRTIDHLPASHPTNPLTNTYFFSGAVRSESGSGRVHSTAASSAIRPATIACTPVTICIAACNTVLCRAGGTKRGHAWRAGQAWSEERAGRAGQAGRLPSDAARVVE